MYDSLSSKTLFKTPPFIKFYPSIKYCPVCHSTLKVYKTILHRKIITLHIGIIKTYHVLLYCNNCENSTIYSSEELSRLIPKHGNFGYDVIEYIGRAIYQRYRTESEVAVELANLNVTISDSEVGYLCRKFIVYLAIAHKNKKNKLKNHMQMNGGYILHIDGTNEGASPHLISALDELSQFVLASIKVPTENAKQIIPLLKEIKNKYGYPAAIVTDMGKGVLLAVNEVFNGILIFICHFHFLRDIGKDLLQEQYAIIRNLLKKYGISTRLRYRLRQYEKTNKEDIEINFSKITESKSLPAELDEGSIKSICYTLIQWALDGKNRGNGYGFPFDRPHFEFYQRLCRMYDIVESWNEDQIKIIPKVRKFIRKLLSDIKLLKHDENGRKAAEILQEKTAVFDRLREAMCITLDNSKKGLNDDGEKIDIKTIEQRIKGFKDWLSKEKIYEENHDYQKMTEQIDKYWEKLFADPITLNTPKGEIIVQPQRTNNIMEQFFRGFRRSERRKSGNNSICKRLQTMIAETPLVKNLENPEYMDILLGNKKSLKECFAEIDHTVLQKEFEKAQNNEYKIPLKIKMAIRKKDIPKIILNLSEKYSIR